MVDFLASHPHYLDHLLPVYFAMPAEERGTFYVDGGLADQAGTHGLTTVAIGTPPSADRLCVVAGYVDHVTASRVGRRTVLLEHGSGQQYRGDDASRDDSCYAGGPGWDDCALFLSPHERVAQLWRDRYPAATAVAIGVPKLDVLHKTPPVKRNAVTTVAVTFHWECRLCKESTSAWPYFDTGLPALVEEMRARGIRLLGHAHPRIERPLRARWEHLGVEWADAHTVMTEADLLVVDNSSLAAEFASLGKPLLWLNAPWYRRDVHHGGRFWEWPRGQVQCDDPTRLADCVIAAGEDPPAVAEARKAMVRTIYAATDGRASQRAVAAMRALLPR